MFEKDSNLLIGKGEWDETEHPRDEDGKFTLKNDNQMTTSKEKTLSEDYNSGQMVKTKIPKEKFKTLVKNLMNFEPITLQMGDRTITAKFDNFGARKNIYGRGNSDFEGYKFKLNNIDRLPEYIQTSQYNYSLKESGKNTPQHKGVKEWHYFINKVSTDKGIFDITINIRDKGLNQFIYEVSFKKKKT